MCHVIADFDCLIIYIGPLVLLLPKILIIWLSNLLILSVPDEGYSRNVSCTLNLLSMKCGQNMCSRCGIVKYKMYLSPLMLLGQMMPLATCTRFNFIG